MDPPHLTPQQLRDLIADDSRNAGDLDNAVDLHVTSCTLCQQRLLEHAADDTWRSSCSDHLQQLARAVPGFASPDASSWQKTQSSFEPRSLADPLQQGDPFDLQTVHQMLQDVLQSPSHPEMLGRLGRYDIEGVIGCGGMGVVLRGFDRDLHRPVAIKLILPRLANNGTAKQRFAREARAAAAVLHPNVIAIHGIDETGEVPWFVMPLVTGPSLRELVSQRGPLPEREIVRIGMQIAGGLAAAHWQGLVHRDIKPENILVDNAINRVVITDFGLARRDSEEAMTQTGCLAGTLNYMSPEQSRGEDVDARSDLFSLGALLYFLAAGVQPFHANSAMGVLHRIGHQAAAAVQSVNPEVSVTLATVIHRLLEKSPDARFQSASHLEAFLGEYLSHLHHPTKFAVPLLPPTALDNVHGPAEENNRAPFAQGTGARLANQRFTFLKAAVAVGILLGLAAFGFWLLPGQQQQPISSNGQAPADLVVDWALDRPQKNPAVPTLAPSPTPLSPTGTTHVPITWSQIQAKYQLQTPSEFEHELQSLGQAFDTAETFESWGNSYSQPPPDTFARELEMLRYEFRF